MEFPTTQWSLLARATLNGEAAAAEALAEFCRRYRGPILQFIRHRGVPPTEAEDLAHDFMLHVIEKSTLRRADAARGRFRSFLIGALVRFLRDAQQRRAAQKHGGGHPPASLNDPDTDGRAAAPPADDTTAFDREWALRLLQLALDGLKADYERTSRAEKYAVLRAYLPGSVVVPLYEESAATLGLSLGAFKTEVHRLRQRFRERLQREVAATLSSPEEIEGEFAYLGRVLQAGPK